MLDRTDFPPTARKAWCDAGFLFIVFAACAAPLGIVAGVFSFSPSASGLFQTAIIGFFVPAMGEEILFRAPLRHRILSNWTAFVTISVIGYTLWHPLLALTLLPEARAVFLNPAFLGIVAGFGLASGLCVRWSGRLMPSIIMHWIMVVSWKQLFGGDTYVGG